MPQMPEITEKKTIRPEKQPRSPKKVSNSGVSTALTAKLRNGSGSTLPVRPSRTARTAARTKAVTLVFFCGRSTRRFTVPR